MATVKHGEMEAGQALDAISHASPSASDFLKKRNKTQLAKSKKKIIKLSRLALLAAFSHNNFADIIW